MTLKELLGPMSDTERVLIVVPGRGRPRIDEDYFVRNRLPYRIVEAGSLTMREIGPILDREVQVFSTARDDDDNERTFIRIDMKMTEREPIATITVGEGVGAEND